MDAATRIMVFRRDQPTAKFATGSPVFTGQLPQQLLLPTDWQALLILGPPVNLRILTRPSYAPAKGI